MAAMFLVLDQIWAGLASSERRTLVVVDEAWWLMREALMVAQGRRVPFQVVPTDEEARVIAGKGVAA